MTRKSFWKNWPHPVIGLSPMDGYSDSAFRQVCKLVNPNIVTYTEFTSADGIYHNAKKLMRKLAFKSNEQPVIAQIFGKNEATFESAAKLCEDLGFSGIDLNMGCPSKKVVQSEHGVALRKKPDLACRLVEVVANATQLPVSVKTRLGWDDASDLIEFGKRVENAGANMICIHARTYQEPYKVAANWEPVYALKSALTIPVIGNGGIVSLADGFKKMKELDGFLIGQASIGNPWVFSDRSYTFFEKFPVIRAHVKWLIENKGESVGCREIRKHLLMYFKGLPGAKAMRTQMSVVQSESEINTILNAIEADLPRLLEGAHA